MKVTEDSNLLNNVIITSDAYESACSIFDNIVSDEELGFTQEWQYIKWIHSFQGEFMSLIADKFHPEEEEENETSDWVNNNLDDEFVCETYDIDPELGV